MTTHTRIQIRALDGRLIAEGGFADAATHGWEWIVETVAREMDFVASEVGCEEPDEDDLVGQDYVTVRGVRVARVQSRPYGHKEIFR